MAVVWISLSIFSMRISIKAILLLPTTQRSTVIGWCTVVTELMGQVFKSNELKPNKEPKVRVLSLKAWKQKKKKKNESYRPDQSVYSSQWKHNSCTSCTIGQSSIVMKQVWQRADQLGADMRFLLLQYCKYSIYRAPRSFTFWTHRSFAFF